MNTSTSLVQSPDGPPHGDPDVDLDFDHNRRRTTNTRTQAITARELSIDAVGGSGVERLKD